ncbi:MAG: hypothetical protein ACTSUE_10155 [Promethearchaeota archaeon]
MAPLDDFLKKDGAGSQGKAEGTGGAKTGIVGEKKQGKRREVAGDVSQEEKIIILRRLLKARDLLPDTEEVKENTARKVDHLKANDESFERELLNFASWIQGRNYLRGDLETAKQMIKNLIHISPEAFMTLSEKEAASNDIIDLSDFLKRIKEWNSLFPRDPILSKQQITALRKKNNGVKLSSTDYRHLRLLRDEVKNYMKKVSFFRFLERHLDWAG